MTIILKMSHYRQCIKSNGKFSEDEIESDSHLEDNVQLKKLQIMLQSNVNVGEPVRHQCSSQDSQIKQSMSQWVKKMNIWFAKRAKKEMADMSPVGIFDNHMIRLMVVELGFMQHQK